jgi:4Fe-4S ferredoxin
MSVTQFGSAEEDRFCKHPPGAFAPRIDRNGCEGKQACEVICPFDVFEIRRIEPEDFKALSLVGRLRSVVHGRKTAYTPNAEACRGCGLCVTACPERAIKLVRMASPD